MAIDRAAVLRQAEKLLRLGRLEQAIAEYERIVEEQPTDLTTANALGDLYVRAGNLQQAVEQFTRIAAAHERFGFVSKASALYKKILKIDPADERTLLKAADIAAGQGLLADARAYFNTVARQRRDRNDQNGVAQITIRLGTLDPLDIPARLAGAHARVSLGDRAAAVQDLKALVGELTEARRPNDALRVAREVLALDADDQEMRTQVARASLADWDFDGALHSVTSESATDLATTVAQGPATNQKPGAGGPGPGPGADQGPGMDRLSTISPVKRAPAEAWQQSRSAEVDLSVVLEDIGKPATAHVPTQAPADLDSVFSQLRDEAGRKPLLETAQQDLKRGLTLFQCGQFDECLAPLQSAARVPRLRFESASLLGRAFRELRRLPEALEWTERAAEAPPPTSEAAHRVLYELADALEQTGEVTRALAICLELQSDAASYVDLPARIDRLSIAQARG